MTTPKPPVHPLLWLKLYRQIVEVEYKTIEERPHPKTFTSSVNGELHGDFFFFFGQETSVHFFLFVFEGLYLRRRRRTGAQQRANCCKGSRYDTSSSRPSQSIRATILSADCLSKKKLVHIKWIISELPLDRGVYLYQEINICSGRFLMESVFLFFKYYCKNKEYHRNINNNILSVFFKVFIEARVLKAVSLVVLGCAYLVSFKIKV